MPKLMLREASYTGVKNIQKRKIKSNEEHEKLVKESIERIEKGRTRYAAAYQNAETYLGR